MTRMMDELPDEVQNLANLKTFITDMINKANLQPKSKDPVENNGASTKQLQQLEQRIEREQADIAKQIQAMKAESQKLHAQLD